MKTAAFILNHNLPEYTDTLYESLKPFEKDTYDVFVIDNGSNDVGTSKYTSFKLEQNVYFGGGFNAAMQYTIDNKEYDSMLFLNNDLVIHSYNFVKSLREEMFNGSEIKYDIVAPSFYNIEPKGQCFWKSMHNWCSADVREVDYIDFQSPLISRRLLEHVKEIDADLIYGWGVCFYFAMVAKKYGYKLGMVDRCCILHHNSLTVKKGVSDLNMNTYFQKAEQGQWQFFNKMGILKEFQELRQTALSYDYTR